MAAPGSMNKNKASREDTSPWPDSAAEAIVFLLDARDDYEAGLLRNWVESSKPDAATPPPYSFVRLRKGMANDQLTAAAGQGDAWMQPLRIAWLPAPHAGPTRSLQDLFHGRITEPGKLRRWWLSKNRPERMAYVVGAGASLDELRERRSDAADRPGGNRLTEYVTSQALIALERSERVIRGARY